MVRYDHTRATRSTHIGCFPSFHNEREPSCKDKRDTVSSLKSLFGSDPHRHILSRYYYLVFFFFWQHGRARTSKIEWFSSELFSRGPQLPPGWVHGTAWAPCNKFPCLRLGCSERLKVILITNRGFNHASKYNHRDICAVAGKVGRVGSWKLRVDGEKDSQPPLIVIVTNHNSRPTRLSS